MIKKIINYFSVTEWILWITGLAVVTCGFAFASDRSLLSYLSSVAGITCIIFNSKGNFVGQAVSIVFAILYGLYAYTQRYYGEMLIYFCLMTPIHIASIVTWFKNRHNGKALEVKINSLSRREYAITALGAVVVTVAFYFLLDALNTDNLVVSAISLTTSITAAYLMLRRCETFSLCFIFNDVVLIILWSMKISTTGISVLPSVLAFIMFLVIDTYCFISWRRIKKRQAKEIIKVQENHPA